MRNAWTSSAQASRRQGTAGSDFERRQSESTSTGSDSATDTDLGGSLSALLKAGASVFGALRNVPKKLQRKLHMIVSGSPTLMLDALSVRPSRWGGRHESAFRCSAFEDLKRDIQQHRGNLQPVLVIKLSGGGYELVFGHRRHRACFELGLPVKALVWHGDASDIALIALQDAENRCRRNPSVLDQGRLYQALLLAKVFHSQRELAREFKISHTWVRKALSVAALPDEIIAAFDDPAQIQPAHAKSIEDALGSPECGAVLLKAAELASKDLPRTPAQVLSCSLGPRADADAGLLTSGRQLIGRWKRRANRRMVIELEPAFSNLDVVCKIAELLGSPTTANGVET